MDLPNILNTRGGFGSAMANPSMQHYADMTARAMSDAGSERGISPHGSDRIPYGRTSNPLQNFAMGNAQQQHFPMAVNPYPTPTESIESGYGHSQDEQQLATPTSDSASAPPKAFACSTCGKGFARRSDLARHERIHTGVRPHVCDHPGCGKQFIQRSALTVHTRVHTGEKPHMCEHCTKPFSDSSSLARHRRIHSGKRPYKCPYAHCQKTFTRRTTLTRHQSHHTGTIEESKAQADAVLANRPQQPRLKTDGIKMEGSYSEAGSSRSSPSSDRYMTNVQGTPDMSHAAMIPRQTDFSYMGGLPHHLRHDLSQNSPRSGSSSPSLSGFGLSSRPSVTSYPNAYAAPPPPLEPPTQVDQRGTGSQGGSPHMSSIGWQTPPQHPQVGSPMVGNGYAYTDPAYDLSASGIYYANQTHRRPQSAEPDVYDLKPRMHNNGEVWAQQMS